MANSEFLTNKEQGDWAEEIVFKAINEFSKDFFVVKYGRDDSIAAGELGRYMAKSTVDVTSLPHTSQPSAG
jgi:hypothetical protein